jgi:uncharacterized membrane protein
MRNFIILYFATAIILIALEFVWLSRTAEPLYRRTLGAIMAEKARIPAVVAFYVVYVLGVVFFAAYPGLESGGWQSALLRGALFGFFAYATYDLTNLATLKIWSLKISLIDMAWGAFATATSASLGVLITSMLPK